MKKDNLKMYIDFVLEILYSCNIPIRKVVDITIKPKASTRTLGLCTRVNRGIFKIELNPVLFQDNASEDIIIQTLLHEYIHTVDGCFNHGKQFKYYADIINRKYNYHISRTTDSSSFGVVIPKTEYKYEIWCNVCNRPVAYYKRRTSVVEAIEHDGGQTCRCNRCHTKGQFKCIRLH